MLAASALAAAVITPTLFTYSQSPSYNACKVREGRLIRNDPYRAKVFGSAAPAPEMNSFQVAAPVPIAAATILAATDFSSSGDEIISERSTSAVGYVPTTVAAESSAQLEHFAIVRFKHETCMYRAPFRVAEGDVVLVEADRGYNTGTITEITTEQPSFEVPNSIIRRANNEELASLEALRDRERGITVDVQRTAESVGLGIKVVDTEFQTDMNKLTVFFSSRAPVDFRKLQRMLFREFRCRIWLVNWSEVEFRRRQADRCLGVSICAKLGSRLAPSLREAPKSAVSSRRSSLH